MTKSERLQQISDGDFSSGDSEGAAQNRLAAAAHDGDSVATQSVAEVITEDSLDHFGIIKVGKVELLLSATPSGIVQVRPVADEADHRKTAAKVEFASQYQKVRIIQASAAGTATLHQGVDRDTHYVTFHGDVVYGPQVALQGTLSVKREDFLSGLRQHNSITTYEPIGDNIPAQAHRRMYTDTVALAIPDNRDPNLLNILIFVNPQQEQLAFQFDNDPLSQANAILKKQLDHILDSMPEKKDLYKALFALLKKDYDKKRRQSLAGSREIGLTKRQLRLLAELEALGVAESRWSRLLCLARFGLLQSVGVYCEQLLAESQTTQTVKTAQISQRDSTVAPAIQSAEMTTTKSMAPTVQEAHTATKHELYAAIAHSWPPFVLKGSSTNFAPQPVRKALFSLYSLGEEADKIAHALQTEHKLGVNTDAVKTQLRLEAYHLFNKLPLGDQNRFRLLTQKLEQLVNDYLHISASEKERRIDEIIRAASFIFLTDYSDNQFKLALFGLLFEHNLGDQQSSKIVKRILQFFADRGSNSRSQGRLLFNRKNAEVSLGIKQILETEFDVSYSQPEGRAQRLREIAENAENSQYLTELMNAVLSYLDLYQDALSSSSPIDNNKLRNKISSNLRILVTKGYTPARLRNYILTAGPTTGWSAETLDRLSPRIVPLFSQLETPLIEEKRTVEQILQRLSLTWRTSLLNPSNRELHNSVSQDLLELINVHHYTSVEIYTQLSTKYGFKDPLFSLSARIDLAQKENTKKV